MKIAFLVHDLRSDDGANRTTVHLAQALARAHDVEIVSVLRRADRQPFALPATVRIRFLVDQGAGGADHGHPLRQQPSALVPPEERYFAQYSRLTDERVVRYLRTTAADVVVGTRPSLNLLVAGFAPGSSVRLAHEYVSQSLVPDGVKAAIRAAYPRLHAAMTVTSADAEALRRDDPVPGLRVVVLPNSVPRPGPPPAAGDSRTVVAAGRLVRQKRYDVLVRAFQQVVARHPDWRLRIYGSGPEMGPLRALVAELGLHDHVWLMGRWRVMESEWVKGSIAAMTSERETFGTAVVEAMRAGLPVVSTACPVGPPEIIEDGVDGLLCPVNDADAVAAALMALIGDPALRGRMAQAALRNSDRFDPASVAGRFEALVESIRADQRPLARIVGRRWARTQTAAERVAAAWQGPRRGRAVAACVLDLAAGTAPSRWAAGGVLRAGTAVPRLRTPSRALYRALTRRPVPRPDIVTADCTVRGRDDVEVRVRVGGRHLVPESLVLKPADTLDERPSAARHTGPVAVGFTAGPPAGGQEQWVAAVPAGVLSEGNWAAYVRVGSGGLRRVRAGHIDTRVAVSATMPAGGLERLIPYETVRGFLTLRVWRRPEHAEVDHLHCAGRTLSITGRWAHGRPADTTLTLVRRVDGATVHTAVAVRDDGSFTAQLPLEQLAARRLGRHDDWECHLRSPVSGGLVRLARLLDDVPHRRSVSVMPALQLIGDAGPDRIMEWPESELWARPFLTADGDLTVRISDVVTPSAALVRD